MLDQIVFYWNCHYWWICNVSPYKFCSLEFQ